MACTSPFPEPAPAWPPDHDRVRSGGGGRRVEPAPENRPQFARLLSLLRDQPDVEIVPASSELFRQGCELHAQRHDKEWSLTDCTSFTVMKQRGAVQALTSDRHFAQAGFQVLIQ